jgi:hypothetical protein
LIFKWRITNGGYLIYIDRESWKTVADDPFGLFYLPFINAQARDIVLDLLLIMFLQTQLL